MDRSRAVCIGELVEDVEAPAQVAKRMVGSRGFLQLWLKNCLVRCVEREIGALEFAGGYDEVATGRVSLRNME